MILDCQKVLKKSKIKKNEIVIVDDGCPEASGYYAKKISKKSKNIKIIFHKKNMGYGAAIRTGLKIVNMNGFFKQMEMPNMMFTIF